MNTAKLIDYFVAYGLFMCVLYCFNGLLNQLGVDEDVVGWAGCLFLWSGLTIGNVYCYGLRYHRMKERTR